MRTFLGTNQMQILCLSFLIPFILNIMVFRCALGHGFVCHSEQCMSLEVPIAADDESYYVLIRSRCTPTNSARLESQIEMLEKCMKVVALILVLLLKNIFDHDLIYRPYTGSWIDQDHQGRDWNYGTSHMYTILIKKIYTQCMAMSLETEFSFHKGLVLVIGYNSGICPDFLQSRY